MLTNFGVLSSVRVFIHHAGLLIGQKVATGHIHKDEAELHLYWSVMARAPQVAPVSTSLVPLLYARGATKTEAKLAYSLQGQGI